MLSSSARRLLAVIVALCSFVAFAAAKDLPKPQAGKLTVYYFDVGQGDAALIVSPTGKTVLVDGGPPEAGASLAEKVRVLVGHPLDLIVLTHPHLDHLGGMDDVIREVGTRRYLDPGFDQPSSHYKRLLDLVADKKIAYVEPKPGEDGKPVVIGLGEGAALTVLWPRVPLTPFFSGTRSDANANSVVFRLTFGKTAFLFTGDSEDETEKQVLGSGQPLTATVLKVAHHGSKYSSSARFLSAVSPKVAVISCGAGNDYHHPHPSLLGRLGETGARVLRTDLAGDIQAVSDGTTVTMETISPAGAVAKAGSFTGGLHAAATPAAVDATPAAAKVAAADVKPEVQPAVAPTPKAEAPSEAPVVAPEAKAEAPATGYAASRRSHVFHRADCAAVKRILPKNLMHFDDRASAAKDRRPAGDCHP